MSDWTNGSIKGAVLKFIWALISLIIFPLAMYHGAVAAIEYLAESGLDEMISSGDEFLPVMKDLIDRIVLYSIPLVILSIPIGYYRRGNRARIPFKFAFAMYLALWIWLVADGGRYVMSMYDITFGSITIRSMDVTLDLMYIVYIVIGICILKAMLAFTEYRAYHKEYLEKLQEKEEKKRRKNGGVSS